MEKSIVNSMIGRTIEEMRVMSFYIKPKLISDIIVLYIKVDTGEWFKFWTSDGQNSVELLNEAPVKVELEEIRDEFAYPVKTIQSNYFGREIMGIKQYSWNNQMDELNGFYVELRDGTGFSIFEEDDCLKVLDGIKVDDNYTLITCC